MKKLIAVAALLLMSTTAQAEREHDLVCDMMLNMVPELYSLWTLKALEPRELIRMLLSQSEAQNLNDHSRLVIENFVHTTYIGYHSGWTEQVMHNEMTSICEQIANL